MAQWSVIETFLLTLLQNAAEPEVIKLLMFLELF